MHQHQPPQRCWKDNRLAWVLAVLALPGLVTITILGELQKWTLIELLWRWLELLIIPLALVVIATWFNRQERRAQNDLETRRQESAQALAREERENDRNIAEDRVREDALQRYFDRMSELILDKNLRESKQGDAVRATARARTLTVLRVLDGNRKGQVVRFLYEADLIGNTVTEVDRGTYPTEPVIHLSDADLSYADLRGARLGGASLTEVNLSNANLRDAWLAHADLWNSNLSHVNLIGADLRNAELPSVDLKGALLYGVDLRGAILIGLHNWTPQQLAQARSLVGASMPDAPFIPDKAVMTEAGWEEFKKGYGQ